MVQVRAGRLSLNGTTVVADPRRGLLNVEDKEGLIEVQWSLRDGSQTESTFMAPGDASVEHIPECRDARVLLFSSSSDPDQKLFFWIQDPSTENDGQLLSDLNTLLMTAESEVHDNTPPESIPSAAAGLEQQPQTDAEIQQELLSMFTTGNRFASSMSAMSSAQQEQVSLNSVLDPEFLVPVLQSLDESSLKTIVEFLPEEQRSMEALHAQVRCPPFQQALSRISTAFDQGLGPELLVQLGLPRVDDIGVKSLLESLRLYSQEESDE